MQPPSRYIRTPWSSLLLAIAAALIGRGEVARGDAVAVMTPAFDAEAHARDCRCAAHCRGASCCCGRSPANRRPAPASTPRPSRRDRETIEGSGPCLGEAPCGDPGLPTSTPPGPGARAAALLASTVRRPTTVGALLPPPESGRIPPGRPVRIDRPPRP